MNKLNYWKRILDAYVFRKTSQLSFWHEDPEITKQININSIVIIALSSIIVTIIVSIYPAFQASNQDPIKSLKYE